jgi:hypothetical protein
MHVKYNLNTDVKKIKINKCVLMEYSLFTMAIA